jgi:hypothetical protein
MNKTFTYSLLYRLIYKFGSVPVTLILLLYVPALILAFKYEYKYFASAFFLTSLIIFINRYFYTIAKHVAYKIQTDDTKITATEFLFRKKTVELTYNEIDKLSGGIFSGKPRGLMKLENTRENKCIAFFHTIENARVLETLVLSKVEQKIYDSVIAKLSANKEAVKRRIDKSKK